MCLHIAFIPSLYQKGCNLAFLGLQGESLGRELWAAQVEVGMCPSDGVAMGCQRRSAAAMSSSCLQGGWLQGSKGFHCGVVKLTIHLITF